MECFVQANHLTCARKWMLEQPVHHVCATEKDVYFRMCWKLACSPCRLLNSYSDRKCLLSSKGFAVDPTRAVPLDPTPEPRHSLVLAILGAKPTLVLFSSAALLTLLTTTPCGLGSVVE